MITRLFVVILALISLGACTSFDDRALSNLRGCAPEMRSAEFEMEAEGYESRRASGHRREIAVGCDTAHRRSVAYGKEGHYRERLSNGRRSGEYRHSGERHDTRQGTFWAKDDYERDRRYTDEVVENDLRANTSAGYSGRPQIESTHWAHDLLNSLFPSVNLAIGVGADLPYKRRRRQ